MGLTLALPAVAALLAAATIDGDVGIGVEGRGTRFTPSGGAATSRAAASTTPHAALVLDGPPLRVTTAYGATLWTSDVGAQPSALVNHALDALVELRPDAPWRVSLGASALRGETDPLAAALTAAATGGSSQLASTGPLPYERLRADARAEVQLDVRTTARIASQWNQARVLRGELRALMPPQHGAGLGGELSRRVTERDTLTVAGSGEWTETSTAAGLTTGAFAGMDATWRRYLTPLTEGWLRAGAGIAYTDEPVTRATRDVLPVAGVGLARAAAEGRIGGDLDARLTTLVDRFTGDVRPFVDARCSLRWPFAQRLALAAQASGGRRLDGETVVAAADVRLAWNLGAQVALEGGVVWRLQRERRPDLPSFTEGGVFMGLQYSTARR